MLVDIVLNPRDLLRTCDVMDSQLPFATAKALNELATTFQANERDVIQGGMTIRRPWVLQGVKIDRSDFATKDRLVARVHVDEQRDFLNKFEDGGTRTPQIGRSLAVPIAARPSKAALIPAGMRPRAFGFKEIGGASLARHASHLRDRRFRSGVLSGGVRVFEGSNRTILIQGANGGGVILQRFGGRRGHVAHIHNGEFHAEGVLIGHRDPGLRVLYNLRQRSRVPASLHFGQTAKSMLSLWPGTFKKWYIEALRTAR